MKEEDTIKPEWFIDKNFETLVSQKNNWKHDAIKIKNPLIVCNDNVPNLLRIKTSGIKTLESIQTANLH